MRDKVNVNTGGTGIGFFGALQIVFIALKLCKVINWSWWIVLIPLWIEIVISTIVIIGFILYMRSKEKK